MKAFKVNADTVAALVPMGELETMDKRTVRRLAKEAFFSLGEKPGEALEITAYSNSNALLIFAAKKKRRGFDITARYPAVM